MEPQFIHPVIISEKNIVEKYKFSLKLKDKEYVCDTSEKYNITTSGKKEEVVAAPNLNLLRTKQCQIQNDNHLKYFC